MFLFEPVDPHINFAKLEEDVLERWKHEKTFETLNKKRANAEPFVFFEGPPTANAKPGIHHVEARAFKDLIPRYQSMKSKRVDRKAGWDTHGLPVELQVEKKLGLKNKKEIEAYGIAKFNAVCREDVWQFKADWEKLTERIGFWLDMEHPYITYENEYIESVWSVLKRAQQRDLLYQGHKVVPFCTRCGTSLSSHEVAQGYKEVTENSAYLKFKLKSGQNIDGFTTDGNTYILAWTTTPWTLPGNVALAVGNDIEYQVAEITVDGKKERLIYTKELHSKIFGLEDFEMNFENTHVKGSDLVGLEYEPLFPGVIEDNGNAFRVYAANFVNTTEGTGVVHTAVMYGEDDHNLGLEVGLPTEHSVGEDGHFLSHVTEGLAGKYVKDPETEKLILNSLENRGLLLSTKPYTHDYPFCWRCDTPLLYYARSSWFIRMSSLRNELIAANNSINWEPKSIQQGRMGEWLENIKDWAISRDRYWGTPLPFWICEDDHLTVVPSLKEMNDRRVDKNTFYIMRHGEAVSNAEKYDSCWPEKKPNPLTEQGKAKLHATALALKQTKIDLIVSSDLERAKQTAEIIAHETGAEVQFDSRLREVDFGQINGSAHGVYDQYFASREEKLTKQCPEGEGFAEVRKRVMDAVLELNCLHHGKTILIVSHGDPIVALRASLEGRWDGSIFDNTLPSVGEPELLEVPNWPFNEKGEVDVHRPYIDAIQITCEHCGKVAKRVPQVADVWLDSGSMPFAQVGYPSKPGSTEQLRDHYPADYISEAIDQTRGWFYTLLAVASIMGEPAPYKNVICLGHVLDEHGKKMSKSKGNVIDPWQMIDKFGADALRFYFYSNNPAGEPKLFTEKDLQTVQRRVLLLWWNVYSFFITYANQAGWSGTSQTPNDSQNILDQWVLARLNQVIQKVSLSLNEYDVLSASRSLADFIDDLSTWYLRRSRSRFGDSAEASDRENAFATMYHILVTLSKLMAPFTPFVSDEMHQNLVGESVHWADWPKAEAADEDLIESMKQARAVVSAGLEARMKAGIKIRQKLEKVQAYGREDWNQNGVSQLIADELNVISVSVFDDETPLEINMTNAVTVGEGNMQVVLDTGITPALKREGMSRELIRAIQGLRKDSGLSVTDRANVSWSSEDSDILQLLSDQFVREQVSSSTRSNIEHVDGMTGVIVNLNGHRISLDITKQQ